MSSTGEICIINKISNLANRYGVSPVAADIHLNYVNVEAKEGLGDAWYALEGIAAFANDAEEVKIRKIWSSLGLNEFGTRRFETLEELDRVVDHALALAPRARTR